jgi:hypothetical protein
MTTEYNRGLNWWDPSGNYDAILVDGYTPDASHTLADILPFECVAAGYARNGTFTVTETVDDDRAEARLDCDDLVFGTIAPGATPAETGTTHVVIIRWITNDADSIALEAQETDLLGPEFPNVHVSSRGIMRSVPQGFV